MHIENNDKTQIIVFDVEGVLIPKNRFIFEVGRKLGISKLLKMLVIGFFYEIGAFALKKALKRIFKIMQGVKIDRLLQILDETPLNPELKGVFAQLRIRNFKIALISSGLPTFIVEKLAGKIGADYAKGIEVGINNNALTGEIWGDVIEIDGKLKVLIEILAVEEIKLNDCIVVADDRNNSCIFLSGIKKIGFHPDFVLRIKSDKVITGQLSGILPIIDGKMKTWSPPSKNEMLRETIHASGFLVPIFSNLIGIPILALLICVVSALYLLSELQRLRGKKLPIISAITRVAASEIELHEFASAPLYFALGIFVTLLLFPMPINGAAIAIFALGDSTASLFGGFITKKPLSFNKGKTIEGSLIGFVFGFLAASFFVSPALALIGALVAMIIESLPLPVNDNILMPLCTGLALMPFS